MNENNIKGKKYFTRDNNNVKVVFDGMNKLSNNLNHISKDLMMINDLIS